jgi:ParB/RepB/Spo0J family partition protein
MENKIIQNMPIERLTCKPQIREWFDEESLVGLAQSLKESDVLQPLLVRREGSQFIVIEGERRLRAAVMAGLTEVPVLIDDRELSEAEVLYRQFVTNSQRENLTAIEKSRAIDWLMKANGWNAATGAVKLGMSPGMVSKHLALLNLPESVQEEVATGSIGLVAAYDISRAEIPEIQRAQDAVNDSTRERTSQRKKSRRARSSGRKNFNHDRERIVIPLCDGGCVAAERSLSLASFIARLLELVERLKGLAPEMVITDAAKILATSE